MKWGWSGGSRQKRKWADTREWAEEEEGSGGRRQRWKKAAVEEGRGGRRQRWKKAAVEEGRGGRRQRWKKAAVEEGRGGRRQEYRTYLIQHPQLVSASLQRGVADLVEERQ
jgi:hypothetical protein